MKLASIDERSANLKESKVRNYRMSEIIEEVKIKLLVWLPEQVMLWTSQDEQNGEAGETEVSEKNTIRRSMKGGWESEGV